MPYISTEALVGAALLVVLAFGYQYIPKTHTGTGGAGGNKKKTKKKGKKGALSGVSGSTDDGGEPRSEIGGPGGQKKASAEGKRVNDDQSRGASYRDAARVDDSSSLDTREQGVDSPAAASSGSTANPRPKTLAERIAPKPRKTKVDDMLAPEDRPATHARVMKIVNPKASSSAPTSTPTSASQEPSSSSPPDLAPPVDTQQKVCKYSDDYTNTSDSDDGEMDDGGWNVVQSKPKKPISITMSGGGASSSFGSGPSVPGGAVPLPTSTKTQRKNAKKAEMKKAARAAEEADRQKRLAMHKKDLEREKINEIYSAGKKKAAKGGAGGGAGVRSTAGATMDTNGRLIWD